jgi:hypothetical protein
MICLGAYTAVTSEGFPPYVSINRLENGDVKISVRGKPSKQPQGNGETWNVCGPEAEIVVPAEEWERMLR